MVGFNGKEPKLDFSKGNVGCSLSRAAVNFLVLDLDLTTVLTILSKNSYGVDEILLPTLMVTDALNMPGGFTHYCIDQNVRFTQLSRFVVWYSMEDCHSHKMRHNVCIFGVADLKYLEKQPHLFGNKIMPKTDFLASVCWKEFLFNQTYINPATDPASRLNKTVYLNSVLVRYNKERRDPNFNISNFQCEIS